MYPEPLPCWNALHCCAAGSHAEDVGISCGAPLDGGLGCCMLCPAPVPTTYQSNPVNHTAACAPDAPACLPACAAGGPPAHGHAPAFMACPACDAPAAMVRLAGGPNSRSGRLEVRRNGRNSTWGTVCSRQVSPQRCAHRHHFDHCPHRSGPRVWRPAHSSQGSTFAPALCCVASRCIQRVALPCLALCKRACPPCRALSDCPAIPDRGSQRFQPCLQGL